MKNGIILLLVTILSFMCVSEISAQTRTLKISVEPKEASIFINNVFVGYGFAEFNRPRKRDMASIRIECDGYIPISTHIWGSDKRKVISYTMQDDGFFRTTAFSGTVNRYITILLDDTLYDIDSNGQVNINKAWRLLHQVLLNYFQEISTTDFSGGYLQTSWHYKSFQLSNKIVRTRVTVRDITTSDRVAIQIKVSSEVANSLSARHGEYSNVDRIVKEFEPMIQELQTRLGKMVSL